MSIDFNTVRTSLFNWAVANIPAGMPVIYYFSNAPRPTVDYVSLQISAVNQIGWDYTQDPMANDGVAEMVGDREFSLHIQAYGGNVLTILNILRSSLQKQTVLDSLRLNGIVFFNWSTITDLTGLVDSRFEQRACFDAYFRMADIYSDNLGVISTVNLEEIYKNPDGTTVYDKTITIPP